MHYYMRRRYIANAIEKDGSGISAIEKSGSGIGRA